MGTTGHPQRSGGPPGGGGHTDADVTSDADVTVLIVDDQAPFRSVARTVVALSQGFTVAGEVVTGEEAVGAAAGLAPTLILMDINLPGINGIEATRRILSSGSTAKVVLLSTYTEADLPGDARTCGAVAYVHKEDFGPSTLELAKAGRDAP